MSRRFEAAIRHLDIGSIRVAPFSGDKKPYIERFVGTVRLLIFAIAFLGRFEKNCPEMLKN